MKVILVLLVCCLTATLAQDESSEKIDQIVKECDKELNISDGDKPDSKKNDCWKACAMKKLNNLKPDGTLDIDYIIEHAPKFIDKVQRRKDLIAKNQECTNTAKGNTCTFAACIFDDNRYD